MAILKDFWTSLSLNQRLLITVVGGAFVVAIVVFLSWARRPDFSVLYANVNAEDAGEIVDELRSRDVPYELRDAGRTILVPTQHVYESRLELAVNGLPESGLVGYEIFDQTGFGVTDFVQRLNYRRALEGEIARTIQTIDEVRQARVHIVLPEESFFEEDQEETTASVVLRLKGSLAHGQIAGITRLVAASVEGLRPDNVTVVDTFGNLLSSPREEDTLAAATSAQLALKTQVERYLRQKVSGILEGVLGQGRVVAQVDAQLDFERIERTVETFDPDGQAVRSEQRSKASDGETSDSENSLTNYEVSKTLETIVSPVGGVKKLTVAVLVDGTYAPGEDGTQAFQPRSEAEMERLTGVIKTAVGFDDARGDRLEVHNVPFDNEAVFVQHQELERSNRMTLIMEIFNRLGQIVVVLLLVFLVRTLFLRVSSAVSAHAQSVSAGKEHEHMSITVSSEDEKYVRMQHEIASLVERRPEEITQLVRTWLKED